jgi:hypothetical protein
MRSLTGARSLADALDAAGVHGAELLGIEIVGISGLFKNSDFQSSTNIDSES